MSIVKNTHSDLLNGYDQSVVAMSIPDPELQAEMPTVKSISLEAQHSSLDKDEVLAAVRLQAAMNLAEKASRLEYTQ